MSATAILAEIVIVGIIANIGVLCFLLGISDRPIGILTGLLQKLKDLNAVSVLFIMAFSYFTGNLVNVISSFTFGWFQKKRRNSKLKNGSSGENDETIRERYYKIRHSAYKEAPEIKSYLDVRYSIVRLFRSAIISFIVLFIGLCTLYSNLDLASTLNIVFWIQASMCLSIVASLISFGAYYYQANIFFTIIKEIEYIVCIVDKNSAESGG